MASSPDLKEVEVQGDVNILEAHLSQEEEGATQVVQKNKDDEETQKKLEIEAKKLTEKINMKKEKMLHELEKEAKFE